METRLQCDLFWSYGRFSYRITPSLLNIYQGAARGLDEGLIGTTVTQKSFISGELYHKLCSLSTCTNSWHQEYGLVTSKTLSDKDLQNKIGNITAMVQIGSVGGALIAFIACDKLGASAKEILSEDILSDLNSQDVSGPHANFAPSGLSVLLST